MPRITWTGVCQVSQEGRDRNAELALKRGWPSVWDEPHLEKKPPVAVVGGGASIRDHVETLREWPGEVWAVNNTFTWCKENGIRATFITSDPAVLDDEQPAYFGPEDKVLIAIHCDPTMFDHIAAAQVMTYRTGSDGINTGPTTATCTPHLAATLGHTGVVFFGCESSFGSDEKCFQTHAYNHVIPKDIIKITSAGQTFVTKREYLFQASYLGGMIHHTNLKTPGYLTERSGGLLRAMIGQDDYDVIAVHPSLLSRRDPKVQRYLESIGIV